MSIVKQIKRGERSNGTNKATIIKTIKEMEERSKMHIDSANSIMGVANFHITEAEKIRDSIAELRKSISPEVVGGSDK